MEKPFYISQLPEKTQKWIKEKTKENFLKDGMSEEEAEQKATDFLDEKVNVAEDFFGKDFYKSIDAIKDNFTPPSAKGEDDYNPQSEVRYTSPEELKLSEMSEEDLKQGLEDIKRGVTDYTDAEEPIVTGWIKDELTKRKPKPTDEMDNFTDSLNDYMDKNPKGRDDIPTVTTRR